MPLVQNPPKIEPKPEEQLTNSPMAEKCGWEPNCPFCKNIEEDWGGDHQKQLQQQPQSRYRCPNAVPSGPKLQETPEAQSQKQMKFPTGTQVSQSSVNNGRGNGEAEYQDNLNCFSTLNLIQNQMKGKNTNKNIIMRHSFKILKQLLQSVKYINKHLNKIISKSTSVLCK